MAEFCAIDSINKFHLIAMSTLLPTGSTHFCHFFKRFLRYQTDAEFLMLYLEILAAPKVQSGINGSVQCFIGQMSFCSAGLIQFCMQRNELHFDDKI